MENKYIKSTSGCLLVKKGLTLWGKPLQMMDDLLKVYAVKLTVHGALMFLATTEADELKRENES